MWNKQKTILNIRPAGEREALRVLLVRVHHAVQSCNVTSRVRDDGVGELVQVVVGQDVLDPAAVGLCRVAGESSKLHASAGKLLNITLISIQEPTACR